MQLVDLKWFARERRQRVLSRLSWAQVFLWDFFIRIMQGVTMAFFEDVWSRNFLNIFATPLLISEYVAGLVLR